MNNDRPVDTWGPYRAAIEDHLASCADYLDRLQRSLAGEIALLADHPAGLAFGDPEAIDEHDHRSSASLRGQKFPSASSLSIDLSSSASASSFFNRAFSISISQRRLASLAFMPPY
jgi:hypothetical protein